MDGHRAILPRAEMDDSNVVTMEFVMRHDYKIEREDGNSHP